MPPSTSKAAGASTEDKWVNVTWMPHGSLSQASHVCLSIRSAHVCRSPLEAVRGEEEEWQVRVCVHGMAGLPLVPVTTSTPGAPVESRSNLTRAATWPTVTKATHDCRWDAFVQVPIRWRDLPRDAYLELEVVRDLSTVLLRTTLPLFDAFGKLRTGLQRLELHSPLHMTRGNPGLMKPVSRQDYKSEWQLIDDDPLWKASRILHHLERFEETSKLDATTRSGTNFGEIPRVPWLDAIAKETCQAELSNYTPQHTTPDDEGPSYLIVDVPTFEVPVLHEETCYPIPSGCVAPLEVSLHRKSPPTGFHPLSLVPFYDYQSEEKDNPVEDKYRTMAHDLLRGLVDPALKPDREQRDRLATIINSPSLHPTNPEKDLLWRFRFSLVDNRRALTKFLLAVDWTVESEVVQAAELLEQWKKRSPIEVTDALKLLGKHVAFQTNLVRGYAIDTLAAAPDEELRLYLLQLVQALKYENMQPGSDTLSPRASPTTAVSSLANFLIGRAAQNAQLANHLYWYLKVELQDPTHGARYREVFTAFQKRLSEVPFKEVTAETDALEDGGKDSRSTIKSIVGSVSKLGSSLRADEPTPKHNSKRPRTMWEVLVAEDQFISGVMDIQMRSRDARGKKDVKETMLKSLLKKEGFDKNFQRGSVPLPSAPHIMINGVDPDTAKMFKSALYPALIDFHVTTVYPTTRDGDYGTSKSPRNGEHPSSYKVIVKTGDDLRQDQLIIMMIQLMDGLLKRAALDLCLTPYSILATSPTSGLVEFVDGSIPISQILANYNNSVLLFFQSTSPQKGEKYDVRPEVISTYIRSCAGYCVITYLLGVGDRHLDNLLLSTSGHFFHIDFGFIFGRDPKPLPPAFRLTREMVEGMGGLDSVEYRQFCSLACQAFNALRKSAGLVINLLHLMSDAGIEDLSNNPSASAEGVIDKVEERFRLELTDEQAEKYFLGLINDCLAAIAPRVMDVFHSLAVARR